MRGRAVVARRAHNPEVTGSNPVPATKTERETHVFLSLFSPHSVSDSHSVITDLNIIFLPIEEFFS